MKIQQIVFTEARRAELLEREIGTPGPDEVLVKTYISTISAGTEKANFIGDLNVSIAPLSDEVAHFPRTCGYASAGVVEEVGSNVKSVVPGDRVAVAWGCHASYNIVPARNVCKLPDQISFREGALFLISTFPLAGMRKTRLEAGEAMLVMGLGILGLFGVQFAHAAGAVPVIACDPVEARRKKALEIGADYALDPLAPDFVEQVHALCGGRGVECAIEVTGRGEGLNETLDCMQRFGRVALLGCTRDKNFVVDYYRKVHGPGITLVGAHTLARPDNDSYPGYWAYPDEFRAITRLITGGRVNYKAMYSELHSPKECGEVFLRLADDRNFPIGVQFDWRNL